MKTNEIRISINAPRSEVFEFTIEPKNTPLWIDSVTEETINTKQIRLGTIYSNVYGDLEVTDYDSHVFFELTNKKTTYVCSYSYRKIDETTTEIIYFESMEDGSDLSDPMKKESFQKLKEILEN